MEVEPPKTETPRKPIKPMQLPLPQFSIWTVMVATAFILLAASHWWTSIRLELARKHVKRADEEVREAYDMSYYRILEVRNEMQRGLNFLDVHRSDQTHVGFLPQSGTNFWQWRLYIPKGRHYRLYFMLEYPYHRQRTEADWNVILEPGEGLASFRIAQTPQGEFEVVRTIDWIDEGSTALPVRTVATRKFDVPEDSWLRGEWVPPKVDPNSSSTASGSQVQEHQFKIKGLDGIGYLRQKSYDPQDLIALVDFMDRNGKQTEGVYIWLEPVKD